MKQQLSNFTDFIRSQGVVGLAVGLAIGAQVTVVDLHNLPDRAQRFVVGVTLRRTFELKEVKGTREPLLFVVDDAHWADEASAELLSRIARACGQWLRSIRPRCMTLDSTFTRASSVTAEPRSGEKGSKL